ncbi:ABC transporter substrate-binding protein [Rathayibacter toxicus]|uniref:ABC transporter substrate-binding protein n=1 Tax=Rathayibacter toxicus TaxID=145458 RepID=UPI0005B25063|nr:peptide ABC transporter substrate-binding protein [Rathayibacter toxicus]PPH72593.1 peptide ABC transporter substrate-binding protein [Rathayibacter toxicus]
MAFASTRGFRLRAVAVVVVAVALTMTGCSVGSRGSASGGGALTIGTTDKITSLDPAGSYDSGSFAVMSQVFPFLMSTPYGGADVVPDSAESAEFTAPTKYTVKLKPGLKWANGHDLTSSDVKFSFDRQLAIAAPSGPSSLLANLLDVAALDDTTVVFTLKSENDQTFPHVLSSPAGPIVDEQVFSADRISPDTDIVAANAFGGQYTIANYTVNNLIQYRAYADYRGVLGAAKTGIVNVKYYADSSNLKLDIQGGNIDVAYHSLSATDVEDLRGNDKVKVVDGPGGEIRFIVFNFDTQPFGTKTQEPNNAKALAVRQAVADLLDRDEIARQVYKGTYTPLYSSVSAGLTGANSPMKSLYGNGQGGPDAARARARLSTVGVNTPITLNLQYSNDHYGPSSGDEYAQIKDQLESSGLFTVNLQTTEWVQYTKDRSSDVYPAYQLGWFPDYSDPDNYLSPFYIKGNFLANHYDDAEVQSLIAQQVGTSDSGARTALIQEIQEKVAAQLPTVPYLQGSRVAVVGRTVTGTENTLDASFTFHYAALSKG